MEYNVNELDKDIIKVDWDILPNGKATDASCSILACVKSSGKYIMLIKGENKFINIKKLYRNERGREQRPLTDTGKERKE